MRGLQQSQPADLKMLRSIKRLSRRLPFSSGALIAVWVVTVSAYYLAAVVAGYSLGPLFVVPAAMTAMSRRWWSAIASAVGSGLIIFVLDRVASSDRSVIPVFIGSAMIALISLAAVAACRIVEQLILESSEAEHARRMADEVQETYRSLYEGVPVGLWRTTLDARVLEANPAFAGFFGYTVDEMLELDARSIYFAPEDRVSRIDQLVSGGVLKGTILKLKHREGHPIFVRANTQVVYKANGEISHFDGVGVDVTGEVVSEQRRVESDERFRWAFESAPIGMALATRDLTIVRANRALEEFLGYDHGELDGVSVVDISDEESMAENVEVREAALVSESQIYSMRKTYLKKDGTPVVGLLTAAQLSSERDSLTVSFVVDLSDQIKAQEALESLVQSKDEFLATVSHELRTPLTVVHGMAHELRDNWDVFEPIEARELAGLIADQSSELAHLVEDLLVVARADAGTLEVNSEEVNLENEVRAALASVPAVASEHVILCCPDGVALADRLRVRQIIRNLVTNASRYGGEKVEVWFESQPDLSLVVTQVRDNGRGVPPELATSIFEPYERAHSLGTATEAVGLGLHVSRTLAERMGGNLTYRREDEWSVFELSLRAAEVPEGTQELADLARTER